MFSLPENFVEDENSETAKTFRYTSRMFVSAHPLLSKATMCAEINNTEALNGHSLLDYAFDHFGTIAVCTNLIHTFIFCITLSNIFSVIDKYK